MNEILKGVSSAKRECTYRMKKAQKNQKLWEYWAAKREGLAWAGSIAKTHVQKTIMTKGDMLHMLTRSLERYRKEGVLKSVKRNRHMNEYRGGRISQENIDAILVDFINYVASHQGVDLGLYTRHLPTL